MAINDLLSQDEVDALLHGVSSGDVETTEEAVSREGAQPFDFANQDRIVRGRMPTLEIINERFARQFRISLFNQLRRSAEISVGGVEMVKFSEYLHRLLVPTSLNLVKVSPLRGTGLFVFDPNLVFTIVDCYFGGNGNYHTKIEGRDFTPTEIRVVHILLQQAFKDLRDAWSGLMQLDFEFMNSEVNPQFANIVTPSEVVVVSSFYIDLEGGGGELHVTMPYSMLEPLRELLDAGIQSERGEADDRWANALREDMELAQVEVKSVLTETELTMREVLGLKPGDVIPVDLPELVTLRAEDIPIFKAKVGTSRGAIALKLASPIKRTM
jgi:flagellar motor switch protein FliM